MSGHSKWSTIRHKKAAVDAKRGKLFSKVIKEITVAARMGGGDPDSNPRLRSALLAARGANMPKDNIERAVQKGTGDLDGVAYTEIAYEGYGAGGVAVYVEVTTDNKNRAVMEVRYAFSRCNGNLGQDGSVAWMFDRRGEILIAEGDAPIDEDELMMAALEAGADDLDGDGGMFMVTCEPTELYNVREALDATGYNIEEASLVHVPQNTIECDAKTTKQVLRLIDMLEECDDVQNVFHNAELDEATLAEA